MDLNRKSQLATAVTVKWIDGDVVDTGNALTAALVNVGASAELPQDRGAARDVSGPAEWFGLAIPYMLIFAYVCIFVLGLVGNVLVIITLTRNRRFKVPTNVFLLNLAVSDLLVGVFCIPFTLAGIVLREFVFGSFMCKAVPYVQGVSVAVNAWTLVMISLERYYAVCHPLRCRTWQASGHAIKLIIVIWLCAGLFMLPLGALSELIEFGHHRWKGKFKCREQWPSAAAEQGFNLALDTVLFLVPLAIMGVAYAQISRTLRQGIREHRQSIHDINHATTRWPRCIAANETAYGNRRCTSDTSSRTHCSPAPGQAADDDDDDDSSRFDLIAAGGDRVSVNAGGYQPQTRLSLSSLFQSAIRRSVDVELEKSVGVNGSDRGNRKAYGCPLGSQVTSFRLDPRPSARARFTLPESVIPTPDGRRSFRKDMNGSKGQRPPIDVGADCNSSGCCQRLLPKASLRSTNLEQRMAVKKKVIRMMFVVVLEFFICWTPLYVVNTIDSIAPRALWPLGAFSVPLFLLLAYVSSCSNPITYCFMNSNFRREFRRAIGCPARQGLQRSQAVRRRRTTKCGRIGFP